MKISVATTVLVAFVALAATPSSVVASIGSNDGDGLGKKSVHLRRRTTETGGVNDVSLDSEEFVDEEKLERQLGGKSMKNRPSSSPVPSVSTTPSAKPSLSLVPSQSVFPSISAAPTNCGDTVGIFTSQTKNLITSGQQFTFDIDGLEESESDVQVEVFSRGDLGFTTEYYVVTDEGGIVLGNAGGDSVSSGDCNTIPKVDVFSISKDDFNGYIAADQTLTIEADATSAVNTFCTYDDVYIKLTYTYISCSKTVSPTTTPSISSVPSDTPSSSNVPSMQPTRCPGVRRTGSKSMKAKIGQGLEVDMSNINSALSSFAYDDVSSIKGEFEALGYSLIATPTHNGIAESMRGTTNITELGVFNLDEFGCSCNPILPSSGFDNSLINGHPYLLFAGFDNTGFRGTAAQLYRDYEGEDDIDLKQLFSPNEKRELYAYVLNVDGTEVVDVSNTTSTTFSAPGANQLGHNPGSNGYYRTNQFSYDDGIWGFRIGGSGLSGNAGPYLSGDPSSSYGAENACSGDYSADDFYWGNRTVTTDYALYFAVKRVGSQCIV